METAPAWGPGGRSSRTDTVRCSCQDHRARCQHCAGTQELNERWNIEDHVVRVPVLHYVAVQDGADSQRVRIWNFARCHETWSKRAKCGEGLAATPLTTATIFLPIASTDVIGTAVTQNIPQRISAADVVTSLANDHREFAFIVNFVAAKFTRQDDRVAWILDGRCDLHKQHRMLRNRLFAFFGMLSIVQADAKNRSWFQRCQEFRRNDRFTSGAQSFEQAAGKLFKSTISLLAGEARVSSVSFNAYNFHGATYRL